MRAPRRGPHRTAVAPQVGVRHASVAMHCAALLPHVRAALLLHAHSAGRTCSSRRHLPPLRNALVACPLSVHTRRRLSRFSATMSAAFVSRFRFQIKIEKVETVAGSPGSRPPGLQQGAGWRKSLAKQKSEGGASERSDAHACKRRPGGPCPSRSGHEQHEEHRAAACAAACLPRCAAACARPTCHRQAQVHRLAVILPALGGQRQPPAAR